MHLKLIYEGKDITDEVQIQSADITDNAGGMADSLEICFSDTKKLWSEWKPRKNNKVQIIQDGFDTGEMYIDELEQQRGIFIIRALSIPKEAKTQYTKAWENVRFMEFAGEIASKYGFELQAYGIENHLYTRVDQFEMADFEFLAWRCRLEGYMIKIAGNKVVIYDERFMENTEPANTINLGTMDGNYAFKSKSTGVYGICRVTCGSLQYEFTAANVLGPTLKINDMYFDSLAEGERYSKGLLRYHNKHENIGKFTIKLDPGLAAGNTINISGIGLGDGKYFCDQVVHKLVSNKTYLRVRRPLEGY